MLERCHERILAVSQLLAQFAHGKCLPPVQQLRRVTKPSVRRRPGGYKRLSVSRSNLCARMQQRRSYRLLRPWIAFREFPQGDDCFQVFRPFFIGHSIGPLYGRISKDFCGGSSVRSRKRHSHTVRVKYDLFTHQRAIDERLYLRRKFTDRDVDSGCHTGSVRRDGYARPVLCACSWAW